MALEEGQRVVVRTADRREWRGRLVEVRQSDDAPSTALVRLDSGWEVTYPLSMVHPEQNR